MIFSHYAGTVELADDDAEPGPTPVRRWRGVFAVDGDDKVSRAGDLTYDPCEGIFVDTLDLIATDQASAKSAGEVYPALKGIIEGNRRCTICNAFATKFSNVGLEESHIVGNELLLDEFCDDPAAPIYRRVRFKSPAFTAFIHPRGIKSEVVRRSKTARVEAKPRPAASNSWGNHKLVLSSAILPPSNRTWDGTWKLSERPYVDIHFANAVSLNEIRRHTASLEFLSCIGDGDFSGPPEITIWRNPLRSKRSKKLPSAGDFGAGLLLSESWYRPSRGKHPFRRAILLDALGPEPLKYVAKWLDIAPRIERLMTLYTAAAGAPNVETRFLFLIQAIEGMHRALDARLGIDEKAFKLGAEAMVEAIPAGLTHEQREFFKVRAPKYNEPSLGSRLGDYRKRVEAILPGALPNFSNDKQDIIDLRNAFSHAFARAEDLNIEKHGRNTLYYCELLRLLFEFNLVCHIGVDDVMIANIYSGNNAFEELERHRLDLVGTEPKKKKSKAER